jgi:hypothetical protein
VKFCLKNDGFRPTRANGRRRATQTACATFATKENTPGVQEGRELDLLQAGEIDFA